MKPTESGRNSGLPDLRKQTKERLSERGLQEPPRPPHRARRLPPGLPGPSAGAERLAPAPTGGPQWASLPWASTSRSSPSLGTGGILPSPTHKKGAAGVTAGRRRGGGVARWASLCLRVETHQHNVQGELVSQARVWGEIPTPQVRVGTGVFLHPVRLDLRHWSTDSVPDFVRPWKN